MTALRVELFFEDEASNRHFRMADLHIKRRHRVKPRRWRTPVPVGHRVHSRR